MTLYKSPLLGNIFLKRTNCQTGRELCGLCDNTRAVGRCVFCAVRAELLQAGNVENLVVGQSPADKNMNTEAENIVGIHHQATIEDTAD
jgi:hypothetical protein